MFQIIFLELEDSGNLNFIVPSLLVLDISIALQKYEYLLQTIKLLHLVSKRIYGCMIVLWLPFTVRRVVVVTL